MSSTRDGAARDYKRRAAEAALPFIERDMVLGVGTGSTVAELIALIKERNVSLRGAISSSSRTSALLKEARIPELDLNSEGGLELYIDGADEADEHGVLIKGGGGALTREKIIASASRRFICIIDESKLVRSLGAFPLPVEVIPMARSYVARCLVALGGEPVWREGLTDNGNVILDVRHLRFDDPLSLEDAIQRMAGVVTVGLFARRRADVLLIGGAGGVRTLTVRA
jgi:ribose 5-phosphate isomerase A